MKQKNDLRMADGRMISAFWMGVLIFAVTTYKSRSAMSVVLFLPEKIPSVIQLV